MLRGSPWVSHAQEVKKTEPVVPEKGGERGGGPRPWAVLAAGSATGANFSLTLQLFWPCLQCYRLGQQNDGRLQARPRLEKTCQ